jgi:hypothetical protein
MNRTYLSYTLIIMYVFHIFSAVCLYPWAYMRVSVYEYAYMPSLRALEGMRKDATQI